MTKTAFNLDQIEAIMRDIEMLDLPVQHNYPILQLVLRSVDEFAPVPSAITKLDPDVEIRFPSFLKSIAERDAKDVLADIDPVPTVQQPKTAVAPQAAFSPAPLPDGVLEKAPSLDAQPELKIGPWTKAEENHLLVRHEEGIAWREVAAQLNRSIYAVKAKYATLTADPKPGPNRQWSAAQERILLENHLRDFPLEQSASEIGKSEAACKSKLIYIQRNTPEKLEEAKARLTNPPTLEVGSEIAPAAIPVVATPAPANRAKGKQRVLPRPCPDDSWPIAYDLQITEAYQAGDGFRDLSIIMEASQSELMSRYQAMLDEIPAKGAEAAQMLLATLTHYAQLDQKAA